MEASELLALLALGEDSHHQSKSDQTHAHSVAAELAASLPTAAATG
jgi:hypothetical protein